MSRLNLSALAVRERAVTLFLIIAVAVSGVFAFFKLGRAEDPVFSIKVMTFSAAWPGATAQQMQDLVAEPLEKRMQELAGYDRVETFTRPGLMFATLTLKDSTRPADVPEQFYQARKKLGDEARRLPPGVYGPFVNDEYSDVNFALYALKARDLPQRDLVREAERLRERLLRVPGVNKVNIIGERPERVFVELSYERLTTLGIDARDIFDALARQNAVTPAGSVGTDGPRVFLRLDGAYAGVDTLRDTPVRAGDRTFRLGDIADIRRGFEDPATFLIRHDGEPSMIVGVVMRPGWNGLELDHSLAAEEAALAAELPLGLSFTKISDQAVNITQAVDEFMLKFFVALAVVTGVSFLSLGWREGVIVAAAVPLTLAAVFIVMFMTGREFDRITLGALILSLGLLVDDAIIAIEMMVVKMQEGMARVEAAAHAWTVTAAPMLSGTAVTVIGLMPVGFAASSAGEYAGNIFWIVAFSLLMSWLVAVVFTPYLGVKLLPAVAAVPGGARAIYDTPRYRQLRALVAWCVRRKGTVALVVLLMFGASVAAMVVVKKQFFPVSERPELIVEVTLPSGSDIAATQRTTETVEGWLRQQPESRVVTAYIGQGAPRFFFSLSQELPDPAFAKIIVLTAGAAERDRLRQRLRERVAEGLAPEARVRATQLLFGPPVPFPVSYRVSGPDLDRLRAIARDVEAVMRAHPDMREVHRDNTGPAATLRFVLDQSRLRQIGLSPAEAAQQLQFLLDGVTVTELREDVRSVAVVARVGGPLGGFDRSDPATLDALSLIAADGRRIPLAQIGRTEVRQEEPVLHRRDRHPTIVVRGDIAEHVQPPDVSAGIDRALTDLRAALPDGYRIDTGGSIEESNKANLALAAVFPVMLLLMLTVIMIQVRSFSAMTMVFLTAPLGLIGAAPALLLFDQPFGFNAILGLIGLAGILMRNTLILVGQIEANSAAGLDRYDAVVEATVQRARPVLLTAVAAVLAFIPLTTSTFWGALAYTLIGGTAVGTVLTLLFLPALFALWFRIGAPAAGHAPSRPPRLQTEH
ncbi:efflux RND transporter permease subunit [Methyloversatilis sp. XJ19-13]|uniref:efflux RND transporter permease subunit n=1 Tax=Methyloversatilis sp. XJ19-13 TaxID=2963430 RepID=UPI00211C6895|nr:efflux RND transporter permease subunit [Methyloversatilis sp. XJ19-13]MCQ9372791.1 efflux RND transporter permease subunit [Methyloversatilis sp. XJ19-13]